MANSSTAQFAALLSLALAISACTKTPEPAVEAAANTPCTKEALDELKDSAARAELLKRCPRLGGKDFTPSTGKTY